MAGNGVQGYGGYGGLATSAAITVENVAVDASGNIYFVDPNNNLVRMVTKSTGIITTVAGGNGYGYSGDGGLATAAQLNYAQSVVIDTSGNIIIADTDNNCIRMVTKSTGIITTVAGYGLNGYSGDGGLATSATLNNPYGVAVDTSGNIIIADTYSNSIRMVTKSTGIITTVAGGNGYGYSGDGGLATAATLNRPYCVAIDVSGNIIIADSSNNRIRMVTKSTGIITTVAGGGGSFKDGGLATSAFFKYLLRFAVDSTGNIYICDYYRIRKVTKSTGIITTVAGTGE